MSVTAVTQDCNDHTGFALAICKIKIFLTETIKDAYKVENELQFTKFGGKQNVMKSLYITLALIECFFSGSYTELNSKPCFQRLAI